MPFRGREVGIAFRVLRYGLIPLCLALSGRAADADVNEGRKLYIRGAYTECIKLAGEAMEDQTREEEWPILLTQSLLSLGRYPEAQVTISNALQRFRWSIRLRLAGHEAYRRVGQVEAARALLGEINDYGVSRTWAYRDPPNLVALGRAVLLMGADPKQVLENVYDQAKKRDPNYREAYLAAGDLALNKHDYDLAAKTFAEALKKFPEDPDVHFGLAQAYESSARPLMIRSIEAALRFNPNHIPARLLWVDHLVDAEEYEEAGKKLKAILEINPRHPLALAYQAVLAHLRNDPEGESKARAAALEFWPSNPEVDYLIGQKLSQKYRFAEGSKYQIQALKFDAGYLPARVQLAQDLLRLGDEEQGWRLAKQVHEQDGYDVTAYNLVTLHDSMEKYKTISDAEFTVRMAEREADIYGDRALALLHRAKTRLSQKYGMALARPTVVEIFAKQNDFAVRTFGMPHNPGFLGVCFGSVVTANSPASQGGHPSNWEAVLWHEFCHVITLTLTRNKMPRWLSEGISVYEEIQANPSWGQHMNPKYREMILEGELTPVADLSAAFLAPESDLHLQFAYYESSLVVAFLAEQYGFDKLKLILRDLGDGVDVNEAIPRHTAPMEKIEKDFAAFARARAEALGPGLDWTRPKKEVGERSRFAARGDRPRPRTLRGDAPPVSTNSIPSTNAAPDGAAPAVKPEAHPTPAPAVATDSPKAAAADGQKNYWNLMEQAGRFVRDKNWEAAKAPLKTLIELYPNQTGSDNAYELLAAVYRGLKEPDPEREALAKWASLDAEATEAYLRLMELAETKKDWNAVVENAERFLGVNPLLPQPYRFLARASEELGDAPRAIDASRRLLLLDPPDPAETHFRLARLLRQRGDPSARRQLLQALEEAPRFREAHRLLLEMEKDSPARPETQTDPERPGARP
jgi:tetratricopeptide (TPR) repeat protein